VTEAFDLSTTYAHLGLGARVEPLPDFEWTPEYLAATPSAPRPTATRVASSC
jgi:hypothetical protein